MRQRLTALEKPRGEGKALTDPFLGTCWRYRVGDDRLIGEIRDAALCILVIELGNRREPHDP